MAGVAGDAHTPIYGYQWRAYFTAYNTSGVPTAVSSPDSEISLDGGTFADCTNEAVAIKEVGGSTDSPNAYLDLTAAEMTCGCAHVQVKSSATGTQPIVIYPRVLPAWLTGTAQTGGSTTTIKLAANAPAYDISGCWVGVDSGTYAGQVRKIASYDTSSKIATVKRAFGGAPDSATYSILVPEAMQGAIAVRIMLALPAYAPGAVNGLPLSADTSGYVKVSGIKNTLDSLNDLSASNVTSAVPSAATIASTVNTTLSNAHGSGAWSSSAGSGAITFTYTLTSSVTGLPIADADVWVTTDLAGSNVIASGKTTAAGVVTFYLDAGTVYVWRQKSGWNFTNPDTEVVA